MSGFFDDALAAGEIGFRPSGCTHSGPLPCLKCLDQPITGLPRYDDFCKHGVLLTEYCEPCEKQDSKDGLIG